MVRGDLSAPTCTTCHGNHGAAPPGVDSVKNVCSKCHVFQAQMYDKSSHKAVFQSAGLPGCMVCHSNHAITPPYRREAWHRTSRCMHAMSHSGRSLRSAQGRKCWQLDQLDESIKNADNVLGVAESSGMEVSQARLQQDQARDSLTKARVTIHSFLPATC